MEGDEDSYEQTDTSKPSGRESAQCLRIREVSKTVTKCRIIWRTLVRY